MTFCPTVLAVEPGRELLWIGLPAIRMRVLPGEDPHVTTTDDIRPREVENSETCPFASASRPRQLVARPLLGNRIVNPVPTR